MMCYHYTALRNSKNKFWFIAEQKSIKMLTQILIHHRTKKQHDDSGSLQKKKLDDISDSGSSQKIEVR